MELAGGVARGDADRACRRVAAEQRTLRAAEHFQSGNIGQIEDRTARARDIDTINIDRHLLVGPGNDTEAVLTAHRERRGLDAAGRRLDREARRNRGQIVDRIDAVGLQVLLSHRGDGDRHVLHALLALLRGDDDFLKAALLAGCLREGRCNKDERSRCSKHRTQSVTAHKALSLPRSHPPLRRYSGFQADSWRNACHTASPPHTMPCMRCKMGTG